MGRVMEFMGCKRKLCSEFSRTVSEFRGDKSPKNDSRVDDFFIFIVSLYLSIFSWQKKLLKNYIRYCWYNYVSQKKKGSRH